MWKPQVALRTEKRGRWTSCRIGGIVAVRIVFIVLFCVLLFFVVAGAVADFDVVGVSVVFADVVVIVDVVVVIVVVVVAAAAADGCRRRWCW